MSRDQSRASPAPHAASQARPPVPTARATSTKPLTSSSLSKDSSLASTGGPSKGQAQTMRKPKRDGAAPWAEGRAVAFRAPPKPEEREGWILTKILRHMGGDRLV
jgi:hypothetical protein